MEPLLIYLVLGAFAGTLAGLLGVGGGIVIVPILAWTFHTFEFPEMSIMHLAVGTSLATITFTAISSVYAHHKRGAVRWPVIVRFIPGFFVGALLGAGIADAVDTHSLRLFFGVFAVLIGLQTGFGATPAPHRDLPGNAALIGVGSVIGTISTIVGIGGGNMVVPFLVWCNVSMRNAVATSSAAGLPIALMGAGSFVVTGLNESELPGWSTGYVYWPAVAGVVATSVLFAPLGARLAHTLPTQLLKRGFGIFLISVGLTMLLA
jgi:uncharacterized protein